MRDVSSQRVEVRYDLFEGQNSLLHYLSVGGVMRWCEMILLRGGSKEFRGLSRMIGLRANFHLPRRTRRTSDVRKL